MHFTYTATVDRHLAQGDILRRTLAFDEILKEVHPHYADKKNEFFQVLTQSCDLVVRDGQTSCSARYITVAPVRPVRVALRRYLDGLNSGISVSGLPLLNDRQRNNLRSFAERLINNNESKYFYLEPESSVGITDACCTFLSLSIALKSDIQYQTLLDARILQLTENFRSKLGWMVGNLYSRVGTRDWENSELKKAITSRIKDVEVLWVENDKYKHLERAVKEALKECKAKGQSLELDQKELEGHLDGFSSKRNLIINRLDELLDSIPDKSDLMKRIENDTVLAQHFK